MGLMTKQMVFLKKDEGGEM